MWKEQWAGRQPGLGLVPASALLSCVASDKSFRVAAGPTLKPLRLQFLPSDE